MPERVQDRQAGQDRGMSEQPEQQQVVVVGADGQPVGTVSVGADGSVEPSKQQSPADMIEQPAKVMRIGSMVKQLLEEVRSAPLDEASRLRLREVHHRSVEELSDGWRRSCARSSSASRCPSPTSHVPTDAELRIAQAQLVGWLEGLFHGIQTALFAQQMAARVQLEQMRGRPALPARGHPPAAARAGPAAAPASTCSPRPHGTPAAAAASSGGGVGARAAEPALEDLAHAVVVVGGRHLVDGGQHVGVGVAHADRAAGPGEHRQVVRHVAEGDDVRGATPHSRRAPRGRTPWTRPRR
jgi:hypothetical protein